MASPHVSGTTGNPGRDPLPDDSLRIPGREGRTSPTDPTAYPRAKGSARGRARRDKLLQAVADDIAEHGIPGFSLRRAARATGTTHKVLLYYFDDADDLLIESVIELRRRRAAGGATAALAGRTMSERVMAIWPLLISGDRETLGQASGLAVYDPTRFGRLGRDAGDRYVRLIEGTCPPEWDAQRRHAVSQFVVGTLRGLLAAWRVDGPAEGTRAALEVLVRALDREEFGG